MEISADFSRFLTPTRQPFPNNQIPEGRWNPVAKTLMDLFPAPNIPGSVDVTGVGNNYLTNPIEPDTTNQFDVRIDHKISDSDSICGRFSFSNNHLTPPTAIPPPLDGADFASGDFLNNARNLVITETHMRKTVTIHCLAAFAFNIGVLAFTINVLGSGG